MSEARWRAARPLAVALAAIALAVGVAGFASSRADAGERWVSVRRDDLVSEIEVSGTLQASVSDRLGPPVVADTWSFKIVRLAPEGSQVAAGEPVIVFDPSELERTLMEVRSEVASADKELEKHHTNERIRHRDDALKLAEAEARRDKAALQLDVPASVSQALELAKLRLDLKLAESEIAYLREREASAERASAARLGALERKRDRAAQRVLELEHAVAAMTVNAPRAGIVVHLPDRRRGEKKKVGDNCWVIEKIVEIPDLNRMNAQGEVAEADAGKLSLGQPARLRLDAYPDLELTGRVATLHTIVERQSPAVPLKVARITIALDTTDAEKMRPGMRFRGAIELERLRDVRLLPIEAVAPGPEGPVAYRKTLAGAEPVRVELGPRNKRFVELIDGLSEGDLVLATPAAGSS